MAMYRYHKKTPEERHKEIDELAQRLEKGTLEYLESNRYKEILETFSKFHEYSFNNSILIMLQKPDASQVASYTSWKNDFNRQVKKGEKGIAILCPMPRKIREERQKVDPITQQPMYKADGTPETEVKEYKVNSGYKIGYTFDVSQTQPIDNGKATPDLEVVHDLQGSVAGYEELKKAIIASAPVPVTFADFDGQARGYFSPSENKIVVRSGMSETQSLKTLIHETTHSILHSTEKMQQRKEAGEDPLPSFDKEIQAESTAYVVANHYGIDTSDYSFPYVATWAGDEKRVKANLQIIKETSGQLIDKIDKQLELQQSLQQKQEESIQKNNSEEKHSFSSDASELAGKADKLFRQTDSDYSRNEIYKGANFDYLYSSLRRGKIDSIQAKLGHTMYSADKQKSIDAEKLSHEISKFKETYKSEIEEREHTRSHTISRGR